jgi:TP53 regulating kinase-like protein
MTKEIIGQGAEAILYRDEDKVIKHRVSKSYRHPELDKKLRQFRTRREAKVLDKLKGLDFCSPSLIESDDKDMKINMQFLEGDKLRDVLEQKPIVFCEEIGEKLGLMHKNNIIHGDLTTSNMILVEDSINFIDFGLSFFSTKEEDKAVDLFLLERALESYHHTIFKKGFDAVIKGYSKAYDNELVLKRLELVRKRGRNKSKA